MSVQAISGPAPVQEAPVAAKPASAPRQPAPVPQDKVSISTAAQAKQASGDRDHDGDSK